MSEIFQLLNIIEPHRIHATMVVDLWRRKRFSLLIGGQSLMKAVAEESSAI
jgi:hypothetical protein